jgi:hypothetical protein
VDKDASRRIRSEEGWGVSRKGSSLLKNPLVPPSDPRWVPEKPDFVVFAGYFGTVLRPRPAQHRA